jgi:hypothetical protein
MSAVGLSPLLLSHYSHSNFSQTKHCFKEQSLSSSDHQQTPFLPSLLPHTHFHLLSTSKDSHCCRTDQPPHHRTVQRPRINDASCTPRNAATPVSSNHVVQLVLIQILHPGKQGCLHIPPFHVLHQYVTYSHPPPASQ